jgi:NTP pyrophosphatase (non-canonical NTP hydrolase)
MVRHRFRKPAPARACRFESCPLRIRHFVRIWINMKPIKQNPTLGDFQEYMKEMVVERGFTDTTVPELFMYLSEEIGELAKAARQVTKMHVDESSEKMELDHEWADVFSYVMDLANHLNIDTEKAFREKEEINNQRVWNKKGE